MYLRSTLVLVAGLALAFATPVSKKESNEEGGVVIVPLDTQIFMDDGDTGLPDGYFSFNPFGNPFSGFLQSMDEMLKNLRDQMTQVLHRLPTESQEWTEINEGKGNTTSTTKVINGHKVTINETTIVEPGENSGSFFKIRIVDVHPASEEDSNPSEKPVVADTKPSDVEEITTKTVEVSDKGSPEIEESANEIPQGKPEMESLVSEDIESLAEDLTTDNSPDESIVNPVLSPELFSESDEGYVPPLPDIETNDVNIYPYQLINDININKILSDQGAPHDPDAEIIESVKNFKDDDRDIFVNGNYQNPNSEFLDDDELPAVVRKLPIFEKISVPYSDSVATE